MKWIEFAVYTTDVGVELVCGALAGVGIDQVSIEESEARIDAHLRYVAPYWDFADASALVGEKGPCVKAYIADLPEQAELRAEARSAVERIAEHYPMEEIAPLRIEETRMDEEDWANNWKRYYKPMRIGEKLLVSPSWEVESLQPEETRGRHLVCLDPGMVFGTGAHHTTRLCLEALEKTVRAGDRVLDLGCGSGILSIAALRLGAKAAVCVDIDPVADKVVRENLRMNDMGEANCSIHIGNVLSDVALQQRIGAQYDIVVANIVADVVIGLCKIVPQYLKAGGWFLCSGIIDEREADVVAALADSGLCLVERYSSEEVGEGAMETSWLAFLSRAVEEA